MAEKPEKGPISSKNPLPDDTYPKEISQRHPSPAAPPMHHHFGASELPPSYEEACVNPTVTPVPYYVPLQTGKGCVLLLQFPCPDVEQVSQCFKRNVPNRLLHNGRVLAFLPEVNTFPGHTMSALIIYFDAQRIALSWLQNMQSFNPALTASWLAMVVENKTDSQKPGDPSQYGTISIVMVHRKEGFAADKAYKDEHAKLSKEATIPVKKEYGVVNIVSGDPVFACGDWSTFPAKASELLVNFAQHKSLETCSAYIQEYLHDPKFKRSTELTVLKYSFLYRAAFATGDVVKFQDL